MLRIKIINELEIPHRVSIEAKNEELEQMRESVYENTRVIEMLNSKVELL